jgi:hypothetical protein
MLAFMIPQVSSLALLSLLAAALPSPARTPAAPRLALPIACVIGRTCEVQSYMDRDPGPGAKDYRCGSRTYDAHSGIDIRLLDMAAEKSGVDVLAAADGKVLRVRDGVQDVSIRDAGAAAVKNQECGNGLVIEHAGGLSTQYCHMAKGSLRVRPGDMVKTGAPLGRVGLSGNTEFPHLHLTVRRNNVVLDPFAPGSGPGQCGGGENMWTPQASAALTYKPRVVLNAGFTTGALTMEQIEGGNLARPDQKTSMLVVYVRALGLQAGDIQSLVLQDPTGHTLASTTAPPLPRDQAQRMMYIGKPRPSSGWAGGRYRAVYQVKHGETLVLERALDMGL